MNVPHDLLLRVREFVAGRFGLDFPEKRLPDLERALSDVLAGWPSADPDAIAGGLGALPDEGRALLTLIRHVTVGETYFFRDRCCFDALERHVLPELVADRRARGQRSIRIWSAGCATGEEPYSLAILLDRLIPDRAEWSLTILATDLNAEALEMARAGVYRAWSLRDTPAWVLDRYFHRRSRDQYELSPAIRSMVTLAPLNLAGDRFPEVATNTFGMDLILCRNVLMYFTSTAARAAVARLQGALADGGWLATSAVEGSAELFQPLAPVHFPGAILYRNLRPTPATGLAAPPSSTPTCVPEPRTLRPSQPPPRWFPSLPPSGLPPGPRPPTPVPAGATVLGPLDSDATLHHIRVLAGAGQLVAARQQCLDLLNADTLNAEAHILHATICQELEDADQAIAALSRAIYLEPAAAVAHFLLGSLLFKLGRRIRAKRCLENARQLLDRVAPDTALPWSGGLTAGRVVAAVEFYLHQP